MPMGLSNMCAPYSLTHLVQWGYSYQRVQWAPKKLKIKKKGKV